jgi:hypothetical protein
MIRRLLLGRKWGLSGVGGCETGVVLISTMSLEPIALLEIHGKRRQGRGAGSRGREKWWCYFKGPVGFDEIISTGLSLLSGG